MSDFIYSMLSNVLNVISTPSWLLYIATVYVILLALFGDGSGFKRTLSVLCVWLFVAIAPVSQWLLQPLEQRFKNPSEVNNVAGVIVLGGGQYLGEIQHQPYSGYGQHSARMIAAMSLSKEHNAPLYFLGGQQIVDGKRYRESLGIERLHLQLAIDTNLVIDDSSHNTFDNALIAKKSITPKLGSNYLLITSAAHMPRAVGAFRKVGFNPTPYAVNYMAGNRSRWFDNSSLTTHLYKIDYAAHEWLGMLQYYALGLSSELFPKTGNKSPKSTIEIRDAML